MSVQDGSSVHQFGSMGSVGYEETQMSLSRHLQQELTPHPSRLTDG